jgi:hypothetical protein
MPRGLGVEPWDGVTFPRGSWPRANVDGLRITNGNGFTERKLKAYYQTWFPITAGEAAQISITKLAQKIAADDIPTVASVLRDSLRRRQPKERLVKPSRHYILPYEVATALTQACIGLTTLPAHESSLHAYDSGAKYWGAGLAWKPTWKAMSDLARVRNDTTSNLIRQYRPDVLNEVHSLVRRGLSLTESLSWLWGDAFGIPGKQVHPSLRVVVDKVTAQVMSTFLPLPQPKGLFSSAVTMVWQTLERSILQSPLSKYLYSW